MKLIFLGTGSAFTVGADNYQSNMLLEDSKQRRLLIDCGSDARLALFELGFTYKDIDAVYISHLHADHVGGLEWFGFTRYFDKTAAKPTLYLHESIVKSLWENVLSGGMSTIEGVSTSLSSFFNLKKIKDNHAFKWNNVPFQTVQMVHVMSKFSIMPTYGLMFTVNKKKVFITTDTQFAPHQIIKFYKDADIIFHDCETSKIKTGVHAAYSELKTLDPEIKGKMWLYHYNPGKLPNAKKDGFRGFVKKGQVFDFAKESTLY